MSSLLESNQRRIVGLQNELVRWVVRIYNGSMFKEKTIAATEFKAKCLAILDELGPNGIVVTKHGRPIAKILPVSPEGNERFLGAMRTKIKIHGDILTTGLNWNAESGHSHPRRPAKRRTKPV
jgi:prevent-host-death family protein